jgi:hypothetical protein
LALLGFSLITSRSMDSACASLPELTAASMSWGVGKAQAKLEAVMATKINPVLRDLTLLANEISMFMGFASGDALTGFYNFAAKILLHLTNDLALLNFSNLLRSKIIR